MTDKIIGSILVVGLGFGIALGVRAKRAQINALLQSEQAPPDFEKTLQKYTEQFRLSGTMESIIPREFKSERDLQNITNNLHYRKANSDLTSLTEGLSRPIWDLLDRGGKCWRPFLCMIIAELYGVNKREVYDTAALCEIIHNGTLMVDDIEDSSQTRRGKPCVHHIYGIDVSLNAGNFMYFAPMQYLLKKSTSPVEKKNEMMQIYLQEMVNLHIGQGWDILWHNIAGLKGRYPSEEDYLQMTAHKTGVLARLATRLVCSQLNLSSEETRVLVRFAEVMGVAFQIQDDLLNIQGQHFKTSKGYNGEDLHEGKLSLMVIYSLNKSARRDRLIEILSLKTENMEEINEAIHILKESGSMEYARSVMESLINDAWKKIEGHIPQNKAKQLLRQLSEFGIKRTH